VYLIIAEAYRLPFATSRPLGGHSHLKAAYQASLLKKKWR